MRIDDVVRLGLVSMCGFVFAVQLANADVVTDWNQRAVAAGYTARQAPPMHGRIVAMVHLAMFEAVNSIEPRYTPYRARLPAEPGASHEAAVAAAAHYLLVRHYPEQATDLDITFQTSLATVTDATSRADGIRLGEQVEVSKSGPADQNRKS